MWLLILAIVILFISALQSAYYVECLTKERYERPLVFLRHEGFLICSNIVFFLAGITMLFIATDWRWGLGGLAIYWLLVVFVLMPIGMQRLLLLVFGKRG